MILFALAAAALLLLQTMRPAEAASGSMRVSPATQTISPLQTNFDVTLVQNSTATTNGAQTDLVFNRTIMEIMSVSLGSGYSGGSLIMGNSGQTHAQAIAEANSTTGILENIAAFLTPPGTVPPGDANFVVITMRGKICGRSALTLTNLEMLEPSGTPLSPVTATNGEAISVSAVDFNAPFGVQDWTTPVGDADCDGYTTTAENFMGTDPNLRCAANTGANNEPPPDRWPVDFTDNQTANTIDVGQFVPRLNTSPPNPQYSPRFDLNQNNTINSIDIGQFVPRLNKVCN